jgi:hypothetical protein
MSRNGVVSAARSRAAKVHASRPHECLCGRVVYGNGGWASHKRACLKWLRWRQDYLLGQTIDRGQHRSVLREDEDALRDVGLLIEKAIARASNGGSASS